MKEKNALRATARLLNGIHMRSRCVRQAADPRGHEARIGDGILGAGQSAFALRRAACFGGLEPIRGKTVFRSRMDMAAIHRIIQGVAAATPIFSSWETTARNQWNNITVKP